MDSKKIKTRFAPSPTGYLHVGGARTALFNWLFARKHGGEFVLRIEDTDQVRSTAESAAGILADMQWLGLNWDCGPQPGAAKNEYFQSMRLELYNNYMQRLINDGRAYEAYETPQQLATMRLAAEKQKRPFRYRRNMPERASAGNGPTVIRFEMPFETITFHDQILGDITVGGEEHDDIIIRKSDGFPTYHFAVVVDDHDMGITHVLRAQEHLMNTPKHLGLYQALGWEAPAHAHMPLVFNMDNTKMSKRDKTKAARAAVSAWIKQGHVVEELVTKSGIAEDQLKLFLDKKVDDSRIAAAIGTTLGTPLPEIDVQDFRHSGYLSDALLNFIALIGWSPGENREIITREEMLQLFSLETIGKTSGRFDRKKLLWMNGEYIRKRSMDTLLHDLAAFNAVTDYPIRNADKHMQGELLAMYQERMGTLAEMADNSRFFFTEPPMDPAAFKKHIESGDGRGVLQRIRDILGDIQDWSKPPLVLAIEKIIEIGEKRGSAPQTLRVAVCGGAVSPPLVDTLCLLGRDVTLARIDKILHR